MPESASRAHTARLARARERMRSLSGDVLLLSAGADLPWLTGYEPMPLERPTVLVLPLDGPATLVVPRLEALRVTPRPEIFSLEVWEETDDPVALVAGLVGSRRRLAVSDRAWAVLLLALQAALPEARWLAASSVTGPLRAVKDRDEIAALARAGAAADRVATDLVEGRVPLVGRTEAEVARDLSDRLRPRGTSGSTSPSWPAAPTRRGLTTIPPTGASAPAKRCSATSAGPSTATAPTSPGRFSPGRPRRSSATSTRWSARPRRRRSRRPRWEPPARTYGVARRVITDAGYGPHLVHRTGHGIGREEHEDPYLVGGNCEPLVVGHAFSVEPGIYVAGRWGVRIEDIVVATDAGPEPLNRVDHSLAVVEA